MAGVFQFDIGRTAVEVAVRQVLLDLFFRERDRALLLGERGEPQRSTSFSLVVEASRVIADVRPSLRVIETVVAGLKRTDGAGGRNLDQILIRSVEGGLAQLL